MRNQITFLICFLVLFPALSFSQDIIVSQGTDVTIENGWKVKITNGGDLIIKDAPSGTGSIIDRNATSQVSFSGGGEAKVELFLGEEEWHYIASPVNDALSGVLWDVYLKQFSEPDSAWAYISSPNYLLSPCKGFAAWPSNAYTGDTTVTFNGELNAGNYSSLLTCTGTNGFNLVGNPYPSAINWQVGAEGWTLTNIDPTIYIWNPSTGQYGSYNRTTKTGTNDADSIIPAKQGFFVHVSPPGAGPLTVNTGTIELNNNVRLHHHKDFFKSGSQWVNQQSIGLKVTGNGFQDETIVLFNENATAGYDKDYEAFKIQGKEEAPQLYTMTNDMQLAVNALKEITEHLTIPVYFQVGTEAIYQITAANLESFSSNQVVLLEDLRNNVIQDLMQNPTYVFGASPNDDLARFILHFENAASVAEQDPMQAINVYAYDKTIYINMPFKNPGMTEIYNSMGQLILQNTNEQGLNKITLQQSNQYFIIRIVCNKGIKSKKIFIK